MNSLIREFYVAGFSQNPARVPILHTRLGAFWSDVFMVLRQIWPARRCAARLRGDFGRRCSTKGSGGKREERNGSGRIGGTENRIEFLWKISQLDLRPRPELSGPMLDFSNRSGLPSIALWQALLTQSNYPSRARLHSPNCVRSWRKSVGYR